MFGSKGKTAVLLAAGALALSVPAVSGAAGLPGVGGQAQSAPAPVSVGTITGSNGGVLGPDGPLGNNGPLHGGGCVAPSVNQNSYGPDGPLGPNGPLGPGGLGANLSCASNGSLFNPFFGFSPFFGLGLFGVPGLVG